MHTLLISRGLIHLAGLAHVAASCCAPAVLKPWQRGMTTNNKSNHTVFICTRSAKHAMGGWLASSRWSLEVLPAAEVVTVMPLLSDCSSVVFSSILWQKPGTVLNTAQARQLKAYYELWRHSCQLSPTSCCHGLLELLYCGNLMWVRTVAPSSYNDKYRTVASSSVLLCTRAAHSHLEGNALCRVDDKHYCVAVCACDQTTDDRAVSAESVHQSRVK